MKTSVLFFSLLFSPWVMANEEESQTGSTEGEAEQESDSVPGDADDGGLDRAQPVPLPPTQPPVVPVESISTKKEFVAATQFSGDFRVAAVLQRLDAVDSRVTYLDPSLVTTMPWASGSWHTLWAKGVDTTFGVRFLSGVSSEENVRFVPWDASLRLSSSSGFTARVGWLEPSFGMPQHTALQDFYLAGLDQFEPLSWVANMSAERVLAASFDFSWDDWLDLEVQFGEGRAGQNIRHLRNRVSVHLPGGVDVYFSEQTEIGGSDSVLAFSESELGVGMVLRHGALQAMGEYLRDLQLAGGQAWQSAFSYVFMTPKMPWDHLDLVGRVRWVDPHLLQENDGRGYVALGSNFGFLMSDQRLWRLSTLWEMDVPRDEAAAIEHEVVLQLGIRL